MSTQDRLRDFIVREVAPHEMQDRLTDDLPLIETGVVDSLRDLSYRFVRGTRVRRRHQRRGTCSRALRNDREHRSIGRIQAWLTKRHMSKRSVSCQASRCRRMSRRVVGLGSATRSDREPTSRLIER